MTDSTRHVPRSNPFRFVLRVFTKRAPAAALIYLILLVIAIVIAPLIAPDDPLKQNLLEVLKPPSEAHWLGTDTLGRDVLSRLLYGGQPTLLGVLIAVVVFTVMGVGLGLIAGYFRGRIDRVIGGFVDILMSLPSIVILLAVLAIFSQSLAASMVAYGFLGSGNLIRIVRGATLSIREELYVSAATVSGLPTRKILSHHVLPGLIAPTVIQVSIFAGLALAMQTGLAFLGLAVLPPAPSWGGMVGEAASVMTLSWSFLIITGAVITITALAFGLLGDGLRDASAERRDSSANFAPRRRAVPPAAPALADDLDALLVVQDYSVGFDNGQETTPIVRNISFTVLPGEILGLVGESGSGKTVTALSLLGLLPENGVVTSGGVWLNGQSITGVPERTMREIRGHRIGLVSQEPQVALDPMFTVGDQLRAVLKHLTGMPRRSIKGAAVDLLRSVKLDDPDAVLRKYPHELSGGMIQRVVIAMALAGDPAVLIADEPTTALDVTVQAGILDLLRELTEKRGMTVILVTHDLAVVADICDRAIVMSAGEIVERADVDDLFYRPQHEYTKSLIEKTPSIVGAA